MTVSNGTVPPFPPLARGGSRLTTDAYAEPGYYADGRFGIRIENVVVCRDVPTPNNFGDKGYLGFENFTMVRPLPVPSLASGS